MYKMVAVLAFSGQGIQTGEKIATVLEESGSQVYQYAPVRLAPDGWKGFSILAEVMEKLVFHMSAPVDALIFVGAVGIAVRAVAPYVDNKLRDPAVVALDEGGGFVIPLLGGHAKGANELARMLAGALPATPVITTATDVNDVFSVDTYARQKHFSIVEKDEIKHLSGALLAGEPIGALTPECGFLVAPQPVGTPFSHTLHLVPQDLVVGMGCRRGVSVDVLDAFVTETFAAQGWSRYRIRALASVDVKRDEKGLMELAKRLNVPFLTYDAATLLEQQGAFSSSEFVQQTVGVDNVCERSALAAAVCEGWLPKGSCFEDFVRLKKQAKEGMTLAVLAFSMDKW